MVNDSDDAGHGLDGALAALREAAETADPKRFGTVMATFAADDYEQVIRLAWRYQFDEDRSKFKRELRELQKHLSDRILARLEFDA